MEHMIKERIVEGADLLEMIASDGHLISDISSAAEICIRSIQDGGKILFMGNGGSAADSQHLATELVSRYLVEREALPAMALTVDTSAITAIGNDYSFDHVFSRQIEALCKSEDVVIGISTSGKSRNVIHGVEAANKIGAKTIALTGNGGGELAQASFASIIVPSGRTPLIQQAHITIGHIICELVESNEATGHP